MVNTSLIDSSFVWASVLQSAPVWHHNAQPSAPAPPEGKLVVKRVGEDLTAVPTDIDPAVTTLILNKNKITRIKEEYLSSFLLLEKLQMENNGINYINVRAFEKNKKLISFKFLNHRLAIFPLRIGGAWRSIVEIVGSFGLNRNMKSVQFANLPALRKLSFNSNKVVNLTLGDLPSLRELHFRYCKLEIFPNLTGAPNLREVYVNENAIKQIPPSAIYGLTKLRKLGISHNRIDYLPDLSHLVSLKELAINDNALETLPDLYVLPSLTSVKWLNNPLVCNKSMCWLRMWGSLKPRLRETYGDCTAPQNVSGLRLRHIHPVDLKCFEGKCLSTYHA